MGRKRAREKLERNADTCPKGRRICVGTDKKSKVSLDHSAFNVRIHEKHDGRRDNYQKPLHEPVMVAPCVRGPQCTIQQTTNS
jgi:hypothetical protein